MSTYIESKEFCRRQSDLWEAEYRGVCAAKVEAWLTARPFYSKDPELQKRYEAGFTRGKEQLAIEKAMASQTKEASCVTTSESSPANSLSSNS